MKGLIEGSLNRTRLVLAALTVLLIAGYQSFVTIPKESDPDISIPTLYILLGLEGISPEDAERLLVKPMERELSGLEGLKAMRATTFQGGGNIILEFDAGFDPDTALADVRAKVDLAKPQLPADAEEPSVIEINLSLFPILTITLSGEVSQRTLLTLGRDLKDRIERIPEVLSVSIGGDREELVELIVDPAKLERYGLDATYIVAAIQRSNLLVAAGSMEGDEGRYAVKLPGLFEDAQDILNMPIKVDGNRVVTFRDVGTLSRTYKDPTGTARVNGAPAITISVTKRIGTNIIETIDAVRATVEAARPDFPEGIVASYTQDRSNDIKNMLQDLGNNLLSAVILVMIVVVASLGLKASLLISLALPASFLTGILVLASAGLTVNVVVLFSLILAAGMLVDGATIVVEFADRRIADGATRRQAYSEAARRMAVPVLTSTATIIAAFLPLLFWPGIVGEFMKYLPLTMIATLAASFITAIIFVPVVGAVWGRREAAPKGPVVEADELATDMAVDLEKTKGFTRVYYRTLSLAISHPGKVLALALATLIGVQVAYGLFGRGVEFFPNIEPENAAIQVHARGNLSLKERDRLLQEVEARIFDIQRERGEFHAIFSLSSVSSNDPEDIIGTINLEFVDWDKRRPARAILADIYYRTIDLAGIFIESQQQEAGPTAGKPIQIEVSSLDPDEIAPAAEKIAELMRQMGGLRDIEDGRTLPGIEWELTVDRVEAAKFGADVALIGSYVRMLTNGMKVGEWHPDNADDELDVVVRLPENQRTLAQLDQIRIQTRQGLVPVSNFITREAKPLVSILHRVDGRRTITLRADVGFDPESGLPYLVDDKVQELRALVAAADLPDSVTVEFAGEDKEQREAQDFLSQAFLIALFLIGIILLAEFNSFYSVFLILTAVIMSTIGVFLGLLITDQPFGIVMNGIGVIALAGVVVSNNIVLIDTYDKLVKRSGNVRDAILRTGVQRLRPVFLTVITTVLGLVPIAFGVNIDFTTREVTVGAPSTQWWSQISASIAFGLTFATILTLIVTPAALMARANYLAWRQAGGGIKQFLKTLFRRLAGRFNQPRQESQS